MMKKRKYNRGFTLVETLTALLILVLLISVIGTGVNASMKAYRDLTFTSESDLLASTVHTAMSDMLRFADCESGETTSTAEESGTEEESKEVNISDLFKDLADGDTIRFSNANYGISKGYIFLQNGKFMVYLGNGEADGSSSPTDEASYTFYLVNDGSYTSMSVSEFKMKYQNGIFSGTYLIQDRSGELTKTETFAFRTLKAKRGG